MLLSCRPLLLLPRFFLPPSAKFYDTLVSRARELEGEKSPDKPTKIELTSGEGRGTYVGQGKIQSHIIKIENSKGIADIIGIRFFKNLSDK